jgi:hypothetical protein
MYSINHPRLMVLSGIARAVSERLGLTMKSLHPEDYLPDGLASSAIWPVYPEIASLYGLKGDHCFKVARKPEVIDLREFVEGSFAAYGALPRDAFSSPCLKSKRVQEALDHATRQTLVIDVVGRKGQAHPAGSPSGKLSPYGGLPGHCFWRQSVETIDPREVDPVVASRIKIKRQEKVASAGSCFAQHISRELHAGGFEYLVTEAPPPGLSPALARERQFGVFSARYGNVYTVRQLVQLFDRAYGAFVPRDRAWERPDGRWADPFRPGVEPQGFANTEEVEEARVRHLAAVKILFERLDVFIFTLGLTEAWRSKEDGAVFPLAPGVAAGKFDAACYEFVNFSAAEVAADLSHFFHRLKRVNPHARMILTVSPVPLRATYEDHHVITSSTYSKAVLRVAAEEASRRHEDVEYFPSYEIITGQQNRGAYFDADSRSIRKEGVDHVMRLFLKHCTQPNEATGVPELAAEIRDGFNVICDEEQIDAAGHL